MEMTKITDGEFYLINKDNVYTNKLNMIFWRRGLESMIVHDCSIIHRRRKDDRRKTSIIGPLQYLTYSNDMVTPCEWCKQVPSEKLVTLWTLQNFDHLANEVKWK